MSIPSVGHELHRFWPNIRDSRTRLTRRTWGYNEEIQGSGTCESVAVLRTGRLGQQAVPVCEIAGATRS